MPHAVHPIVEVDGARLSGDADRYLQRTVVDTHVHLPDMFELTFLDQSGSVVADAGIRIGSQIAVFAGAPDSSDAPRLILGEVTSIEGELHDLMIETVVRGYEKAHRLQRGRKTRTYANSKDSDIARTVADAAGLDVGTIDATGVVHDLVSQVCQSDWDFLRGRAREIGWEMGVVGGEFFFRRPVPAAPGGGGAAGALAGAAAGASGGLLGGAPVELTFKDKLYSFRPRVSAASQVPSVRVRAWDPANREPIEGETEAASVSAKLAQSPADLATATAGPALPVALPSLPAVPGLPSFGPPDDGRSYVAVGRPLASQAEADAVARSVAEHIGSTFAEAEGTAEGNPAIQAGAVLDVSGVPLIFQGSWVVTNARHLIESGVYSTAFVVSGRQERSLLGLASIGASNNDAGAVPRIPGLVPAIVADNNDPEEAGRVRLMFPWLAGDYVSDWARVAQLGAGQAGGAVFLPEKDDEVLAGFEFGDVRRPYVVAGMFNPKDAGRPDLSGLVSLGTVARRGIVSRLGHQLVFFEDDMLAAGIALMSADGKLRISLNQTDGALKITADQPAGSMLTLSATGDVTVEAKAPGKVTISAGADIAVEAGQKLSLSGKAGVSIDGGPGGVKITGQRIELN